MLVQRRAFRLRARQLDYIIENMENRISQIAGHLSASVAIVTGALYQTATGKSR